MRYQLYVILVVAVAAVVVWWYYHAQKAEYFSAGQTPQFPSRFLLLNKTLGKALQAAQVSNEQTPVTAGDLLRANQFTADVNSSGRVCFRSATDSKFSLMWVSDDSGGEPSPSSTPGGESGPGGGPDDPGFLSSDDSNERLLILSPNVDKSLPEQYFIVTGSMDDFQITYPAGQKIGEQYPTPTTDMNVYCGSDYCNARPSAGDSFSAVDMSVPLPPAFLLQSQDGFFQSDGENLSIAPDRRSASSFSALADGTVSVGDSGHWLRRVTDGFRKQTVVTQNRSEATVYNFEYRAPVSDTQRLYTVNEVGSGEFLVASGDAIGENSDINRATLFTVDFGCSAALEVYCASGLLCDPATGACSSNKPGCSSTADCTPGYICDTGRSQCVPDGG